MAKAMAILKQDGNQNPSLPAIRAAVGNKGSMSTIAGFKKELDDEALAAQDPPDALQAFRAIWAQAVQVGRAQRDSEVADLQELARELSSESKEFEGEATASRSAATAVTQKYEVSLVQLNRANEALIAARADAERNATKLVEVMEESRREADHLRNQLTAEKNRAHELELKLAHRASANEAPTNTPSTKKRGPRRTPKVAAQRESSMESNHSPET